MKGVRLFLALASVLVLLVIAMACETDPNNPERRGDVVETGETTGGGAGGCAEYCRNMVAACPEGDTQASCESSCNTVPTFSNDALECSGAATDCQSAGVCWGLFTWI